MPLAPLSYQSGSDDACQDQAGAATLLLIPTPLLCDGVKEQTRKHLWKGMNIIYGTSNENERASQPNLMIVRKARSRMQDVIVITAGQGQSVAIGPTRTTFLTRSQQTEGRYSLVEHTFPPQFTGPPPHVHRHYDHAWYVLEGEVQLTCGDRLVSASAGTFVLVPRGIAHTFSNPGTVPARMLEIDAPGGFEPYFEELAAAIPEGAPVNPSVVVDIQRKYDTFPPDLG